MPASRRSSRAGLAPGLTRKSGAGATAWSTCGGGEDGADAQERSRAPPRRWRLTALERPRSSQRDLDDRDSRRPAGPGPAARRVAGSSITTTGMTGETSSGATWWTDSCAGPLAEAVEAVAVERRIELAEGGPRDSGGHGRQAESAPWTACPPTARCARVWASVGTRPVPPRPPTTSDDAAAASRAAGPGRRRARAGRSGCRRTRRRHRSGRPPPGRARTGSRPTPPRRRLGHPRRRR